MYYLIVLLHCFRAAFSPESLQHDLTGQTHVSLCDFCLGVVVTVLPYFLTLERQILQAYLVCFPLLKLAVSPRSSGSFIGRWDEKQNLGTRVLASSGVSVILVSVS